MSAGVIDGRENGRNGDAVARSGTDVTIVSVARSKKLSSSL
jgi:hypothetical protein